MRVALDISPTIAGHKVRGIGAYCKYLIDEFKKRKWGIEFEFFTSPNSPPPADVVHYPYFDLFLRTLPVKRRTNRVVTIHDVIPLVFPQYFPTGIKGYINLFFQKMALKNVDAIICDSSTSKSDIIDKLSYPPQKTQVIHLAPGPKFHKVTSDQKFSKVVRKLHLPKVFILYVGDVNWNKNIINLLEAVKISKVNLVMVGSALIDQKLVQSIEIDQKIKKLDITNQIIKTGYLGEDELVAIYNLARLTVLPSLYEGFGLPVLESMACGTPVVCSDVASLSEIAKPTAIFCDPTNPVDIAKKILYILNLPPKEKGKLSKKSQDHAAKFTWQRVAQETIRVYKSVL